MSTCACMQEYQKLCTLCYGCGVTCKSLSCKQKETNTVTTTTTAAKIKTRNVACSNWRVNFSLCRHADKVCMSQFFHKREHAGVVVKSNIASWCRFSWSYLMEGKNDIEKSGAVCPHSFCRLSKQTSCFMSGHSLCERSQLA